jgi:hypothetical protein
MNNELTEFEQQNAIFPEKVWKFEIKCLSLHRSNFYGAEDVAPQGGNFYATTLRKKHSSTAWGMG